jgi:hypothetical protein
MLICVSDAVTTIKPGHETTVNAPVIWSDESSFMLYPTSGRVYVWSTPKGAYNPEFLVPTAKHGEGCDDFGRNIVVQHFVGPIITLHGRFTETEYVYRLANQVHRIIGTLSPNSDTVFQHDSAPIPQLEVFSHGVKRMKANFSTFSGQNNQQIPT